MQLDVDSAIPLGLIVNELLTNAFKHAFPEDRKGIVYITCKYIVKDRILLEVADNGIGLLEFDKEDKEYFLELDSWDDYILWTQKEKTEMSPICTSCKYFGKCLTEHYRYVKDLTNSCNGYKGLLDWADLNLN